MRCLRGSRYHYRCSNPTTSYIHAPFCTACVTVQAACISCVVMLLFCFSAAHAAWLDRPSATTGISFHKVNHRFPAPPLTRARRNPKNWSQDVSDYISDDRFARFDAGPSHVRALAGVLRLQIVVVSDAGGTTLYPANGAPPHDFVLSDGLKQRHWSRDGGWSTRR